MDVLLHAVSHYALVNEAVDAGDYEARKDHFLVSFGEDYAHVPALGLIEISPSKIDWERYPEIKYLVCWNSNRNDRNSIALFFEPVFEYHNLNIWRRIK